MGIMNCGFRETQNRTCTSEWRRLMVLFRVLIRVKRIATVLCRLLFGTAQNSDTLLLMTILSTPLQILKQRGYTGRSACFLRQ